MMCASTLKDIHRAAQERKARMGLVQTKTIRLDLIRPEPKVLPPVVVEPIIFDTPAKIVKPKVKAEPPPQLEYFTKTRLASMREIVSTVCAYYGVSDFDLQSDRRTADLIYPRHIAYYLCKVSTRQSNCAIGRFFDRDHTTILHGIRNIEKMMETREYVYRDIQLLRGRLTVAPQSFIYWGC